MSSTNIDHSLARCSNCVSFFLRISRRVRGECVGRRTHDSDALRNKNGAYVVQAALHHGARLPECAVPTRLDGLSV
eukprot:5893918-Prymnesium_polylepis.1